MTQSKAYNVVLLDWDGNIAKTLDLWLDAYRVTLANHGVHKSDIEICKGFGQFEKQLARWGIENPAAVAAESDIEAGNRLGSVELYPDALYVLEELAERGKKLVLITTSNRDHVAPALKKHGLDKLFEHVLTYEDTEEHKPHPEPLERALSLLGAQAEDAIMIGDTDKDIGAAFNAGIDSILFFPPEHEKFYELDSLRYYEPTHIIDDFTEVLEIVE